MERITQSCVVFESDHRGGSTLDVHCHRTAFATIVLDGSYVEIRDGAPSVYVSGQIVVHAPSEEHTDFFKRQTRCLNVELPEVTVPMSRDLALSTESLRKGVRDVIASFYSNARELHPAVGRLQGMLAGTLHLDDTRPPWLRRVMECFAWEQAVPLRAAAEIASVHETHFSRSFRRHVGMTANEYRARARIKRASELLLTSTHSLARIAASCGFSDQSHLTRTFGERVGLTPAAYRRAFVR